MTGRRSVTREEALSDPAWLAGKLEYVLEMELANRVLTLSVADRARRWALSILSGYDALPAEAVGTTMKSVTQEDADRLISALDFDPDSPLAWRVDRWFATLPGTPATEYDRLAEGADKP